MKFITHTLLAVLAFIGFYLLFILPDSVWMDKHGFGEGYKPNLIYYGSYVLGGLIWVFVAFKFYKGFASKPES